MIIIKLQGGLGNQLFQYALGRTLSVKTGTPLKFDATDYGKKSLNTPRVYRLGEFNVAGSLAHDAEIEQFIKPKWRTWLSSSKPHIIVERSAIFDPLILETKPPAYLAGYWQSEKYFASIKEVLKKELTLRTPLSPYYAKIARKIDSTKNPTAVHIRRGDYVTSPSARLLHGICSPEYYIKAFTKLTEKKKAPFTIFVFSDDIPWVQKHIHVPFDHVFVSAPNNEVNECMELMLMRKCHYHIVANSSFSWWGAWLSDFPQKVIIAPKQWVLKDSLNTSDRIPPEWIVIENAL